MRSGSGVARPALLNTPVVTAPYNLIDSGTSDWPKETLDLPWRSAEEARLGILDQGWTVEKFKELDIYKFALASGRYPWLVAL